ncbi:hypothetical protein MLD38_017802 [Melastoma candidum]|uniref:Uncharacterized protein n=1 Tax=Melastoma candidum TaxID=119954 RepID=A0ACB9QRW8_9MYRT|nr:hypothetical protein MLD38_017802 [Melastoma candidum]
MASKHGRDKALDWELLSKDKDKKVKVRPSEKGSPSSRVGAVGLKNEPGNYDASRIADAYSLGETVPDAASEKELGNEFFKQKKFNEAIDCYSRSIAFSPTAVAYANRAMSYLKIKRFREAEDDCTEALNLDDRYIKAYSRRATARKELGKLKESLEDAEFALRLEPVNQEVKKQYADVKALYGKEILKKASSGLRTSSQAPVQGGKVENGLRGSSVSKGSKKMLKPDVVQELQEENNGEVPKKNSTNIEEIKTNNSRVRSNTAVKKNSEDITKASMRPDGNNKQALTASVQELASRASSRAMDEAARNISPPTTAYQFEVSWRGFSGDCTLQYRLLKVTPPSSLSKIFKNALTAPLLVDIVKCVGTFFREDRDLAVKYLENLATVPRFDMLIMCLSSSDKADMIKLWNEVFCSEATPIESAGILDRLRVKYCLKR